MKKVLLIFFTLVLMGCSVTAKNHKKKGTKESSYFTHSELTEYVQHSAEHIPTKKAGSPFDKLSFTKIVAYDFQGIGEGKQTVLNQENRLYAQNITQQKALNLNQINTALKFLTDEKTYGEVTAACFEPKMGLVFYNKNQPVFVIDICLDCNFLTSTTEIPASSVNRQTFDDGTFYPLKGFSKKGVAQIVSLAKELGMGYGQKK